MSAICGPMPNYDDEGLVYSTQRFSERETHRSLHGEADLQDTKVDCGSSRIYCRDLMYGT